MRKVKLIVCETYQGKRKSEDVFAAVFLSNAAALTENTEHVYLSGDFSKSYEKAMAYAKSKLGYGIYNLLVNNCLHYAIDILSAGDCDNSAVETVTSFSPTFIPRLFYYELLAANSLGSSLAPGLNRPKNRHFTTAEVF